jgi:hypothetical protein
MVLSAFYFLSATFLSPCRSIWVEMVLKPQIAFESPAKKRDFTPIFIKIIEFNKRRPMKKRSPPHILTDEPSRGLQRSYSAGGGLDGVLKLFLIAFPYHSTPSSLPLHFLFQYLSF